MVERCELLSSLLLGILFLFAFNEKALVIRSFLTEAFRKYFHSLRHAVQFSQETNLLLGLILDWCNVEFMLIQLHGAQKLLNVLTTICLWDFIKIIRHFSLRFFLIEFWHSSRRTLRNGSGRIYSSIWLLSRFYGWNQFQFRLKLATFVTHRRIYQRVLMILKLIIFFILVLEQLNELVRGNLVLHLFDHLFIQLILNL